MRVIAGTAKGRKLISPSNLEIRPTADRLKESLFNILAPQIVGSRLLDLFAGTGSLGIEALSRGAEFVLFCDRNKEAVNIIKKNLELCHFTSKAQISQGDALTLIDRIEGEYRMVFVDPPYNLNLAYRALERIALASWLTDETLVLIEHHIKEVLPSEINGLTRKRQLKQGEKQFSFYQKEKKESDIL